MDEFSNVQENEIQDKRETIKQKLRQYYDGRDRPEGFNEIY